MIFKLAVLLVGYASAWDIDDCECGRINLPVCGSDGVTYDNDCLLKCAQPHVPNLTQAYEGSCRRARDAFDLDACECGRIDRPVCGSDGMTYSNECFLKCAQPHIPNLTQVNIGPCQIAARPVCMVTLDYQPVCGTNNVTYPNQSALRCAKADYADLEVKHKGTCEGDEPQLSIQLVEPPKDSQVAAKQECMVTLDYQPVCGTNNVTYPNQSSLRCAKADYADLEVKHRGTCEGDKPQLSIQLVEPPKDSQVEPKQECIFTLDYKPVCATNNVTYPNENALRCAKAVQADLEVKHPGTCEGNKPQLSIQLIQPTTESQVPQPGKATE